MMRSHRVRVRHCFSTKTIQINSRSNGSKIDQGASHHQTGLRHIGSASDMADELQSLQSLNLQND